MLIIHAVKSICYYTEYQNIPLYGYSRQRIKYIIYIYIGAESTAGRSYTRSGDSSAHIDDILGSRTSTEIT